MKTLKDLSLNTNFILSSGGGLSGGTPPKNIDAMIQTLNEFKMRSNFYAGE